jgi:hypothetical protein
MFCSSRSGGRIQRCTHGRCQGWEEVSRGSCKYPSSAYPDLSLTLDALQYEVCLAFGETELVARLRWKSDVSYTFHHIGAKLIMALELRLEVQCSYLKPCSIGRRAMIHFRSNQSISTIHYVACLSNGGATGSNNITDTFGQSRAPT